MTHDELSKFTHKELENFTNKELEMNIADLLEKSKNDDSEVPYGVILKLQNLCDELENVNVTIPDQETLSDIRSTRKIKLLKVAKFLSDIYDLYKLIPNEAKVKFFGMLKDIISDIHLWLYQKIQ